MMGGTPKGRLLVGHQQPGWESSDGNGYDRGAGHKQELIKGDWWWGDHPIHGGCTPSGVVGEEHQQRRQDVAGLINDGGTPKGGCWWDTNNRGGNHRNGMGLIVERGINRNSSMGIGGGANHPIHGGCTPNGVVGEEHQQRRGRYSANVCGCLWRGLNRLSQK
ncbi:hypothetical protein SAMN04488109_1217 [Chryseolinea serpens]|uniref:Uncharacterized protein n=1 Tax=Chryseolinea serpens TaxID=947013 RepID=A0A1M5LHR1_9BACT|nr:hypothetical protein SAMN04488109_1217 [Chryseolinea serpens]